MRLLIADHPATCVGIRMALDGEIDVCAEVGDAESAIRASKREQPDACLLAREISGDWLGAVRGICRAAPSTAVVVLAQVQDAEDLLRSVRAGAIGYVPGPLDRSRLRRIIAAIATDEAIVPRSMVLELLLELRTGRSGGDSLTGRESQVLGMLRRGHTTVTIARELEITPVTVRRHISELVHKLGVGDRSGLIGPTPLARARSGHVTGTPSR